jgi:hypothetical protein
VYASCSSYIPDENTIDYLANFHGPYNILAQDQFKQQQQDYDIQIRTFIFFLDLDAKGSLARKISK